MAIWNRFFGSAVSTTAGVAVGGAIQPTLDPITRELANLTWALYKTMPIDPYYLAQGVAQGQIAHGTAETIATHSGISEDNFQHMIDIANVGPGASYAFEMWRRLDTFSDADFAKALTRMGLEAEWIPELKKIKNVLLSPATIANAVQQGHMPNDGILPEIDPTIGFPAGYSQPTAPDDDPPSHVPLTQIPIDPTNEAQGSGITKARLQVEANLVGLPPGPEALLAMWNRNLIDQESVDAGIREGHMKTKWAHAYKRMRWAVLSAEAYAELWLRQWITREEAEKGGALTGHTPEQMDLLYKNRGRPISPTQALTALVRKSPRPQGAGYPSHTGPFNEEDFSRAISRSNIRTEYIPTLRESLYLYPSPPQLNRLVQSGAIDADTARDWAINDRFAPEVVTTLHTYWQGLAGPTTATVAPRVKAAQTTAIAEIRSAFLIGQADEAQARDWLGRVGVDATEIDGIIPIWNVMLEVPQKGLSVGQIKKAYENLTAQWPRQRALDELQLLGLTADDAATILDE
jgi:hypothetical protein